MKQMAISAVLGLILLPLLTLEASAAQKSAKDAGWTACVEWCLSNRFGAELHQCIRNCDCYYYPSECKGGISVNPMLQQSAVPKTPGIVEPVAPTPNPTLPTFNQTIQRRGVEGDSATSPATGEKDTAPAPKK